MVKVSDSTITITRTIDWNGNAYFAGTLTLGSTTITEAQLLELLNMLSNKE